MRGGDEQTGALFSSVSCEARVPPDHPLRLIRAVVDEALDVLSPEIVGLSMDAPVWDASTFSKNRDRLLDGDVARRLLSAVMAQPRIKALMSHEHFSIDGTLIQAWASHQSFQPKPGPDAGPPVRRSAGPR